MKRGSEEGQSFPNRIDNLCIQNAAAPNLSVINLSHNHLSIGRDERFSDNNAMQCSG